MPSAWAACSASHSWPSNRPVRAGLRQVFRISSVSSVMPLNIFHDDARPLRIVERGIVKRHDIGMLEPGHQQRFPLEPLLELGVRRDMIVHDLDDDLAAQVDLPREIDPPHASFAQELDGLIPTQETCGLPCARPG